MGMTLSSLAWISWNLYKLGKQAFPLKLKRMEKGIGVWLCLLWLLVNSSPGPWCFCVNKSVENALPDLWISYCIWFDCAVFPYLDIITRLWGSKKAQIHVDVIYVFEPLSFLFLFFYIYIFYHIKKYNASKIIITRKGGVH